MPEDSETLTFVTGNALKLRNATQACANAGISLVQSTVHIDEIQSEDGETIARRKADDAYELLHIPLIVNDDSWIIPGLKGFPGPYMKSINHWFSIEDWARLTSSLKDREIYLRQIVIYQDTLAQRMFEHKVMGVILPEPRGDNGVSMQSIVSLEGDDGKSIAEVLADDPSHFAQRAASIVWNEFAEWFSKEQK